jgi:hypothetical protein
MALQVINGVGQFRLRNPSNQSNQVSFDTDAQSFITAASLTDTTQTNAVNDLVLDLKAAGLWTKISTLYPMVGGNATSHKFNLKDPRDLDAAYRLVFNGGWTHNTNGATPNGTDAYAKTFISTSVIGLNTGHLSYYSRTNDLTTNVNMIELGAYKSVPDSYTGIQIRSASWSVFRWNNGTSAPTVGISDTLGLYVASRTGGAVMKGYKNGYVIAGFSTGAASYATSTIKMYLGAGNSVGTSNTVTDAPSSYSNKQCAFASVGSGFTDSESQIFYQIVEKFQVALGRNVNTSKSFYFNRNYSIETNMFIFNAGITDGTQMSAVDTLVTTLKTSGLWTKMKAVYPMVGGTALAHKFNLLNPVDSTSAYALTFVGGWNHSVSGATPNGSNAYANTSIFNNVLTNNNTHLSYYSKTNVSEAGIEMGINGTSNVRIALYLRYNSTTTYVNQFISTQYSITGNQVQTPSSDSLGYFIGSRTSDTVHKAYKNGAQLGSTNTTPNTVNITSGSRYIYLGALNNLNIATGYSTKQCAFATIGDGLTDAEANTLTDAVQSFQTTLGRQV